MSRIQRRKFKLSPTTIAKQSNTKQGNRTVEHSTTQKPAPKAKSKKANTTSIEQTKLPERKSSKIKGKLSIKSLKKNHNTPIDTTDNNNFLSGLKKK